VLNVEGTLVLTNKRVVFAGSVKTVPINLDRIVNLDTYKDAVAILHQGREDADIFLINSPQYFVWWLNYWIDAEQAAS